MVEGYGNLNQSLKKFFVFWRRVPPNVFEGFVGVEELGLVKQSNSAAILLGVHPSFLHRPPEET